VSECEEEEAGAYPPLASWHQRGTSAPARRHSTHTHMCTLTHAHTDIHAYLYTSLFKSEAILELSQRLRQAPTLRSLERAHTIDEGTMFGYLLRRHPNKRSVERRYYFLQVRTTPHAESFRREGMKALGYRHMCHVEAARTLCRLA
jgi:hypothetical protein